MKVFYNIIIIFIYSLTIVEGQKSIILQSNGSIETNFYNNTIAAYNDGYFVLFSTEESNADLIVSKYDNCHVHLWTKRYDSSLDISVYDALVHNGQLIILMVTHFNSSTTRTPILLAIDMNGAIQFSNQYNKDRFDNFINLSRHNFSYHIFGPSSNFPDGGGHFAIDKKGDLINANVLINNLSGGGSDFGCTVLDNGMAIRRHNSTLIACDQNQKVLWAKQFKDYNGIALSELDPLILPDGFVQVLSQSNKLVLFKMDFQGNIIWSIVMNGRHSPSPINYKSGLISLLWRSAISENEYRLAYTEVNQSNGDIIVSKVFEFENETRPEWPMHIHTSSGDEIITGSNSMDGSDNQDFLFINPFISQCLSAFEINPSERIELVLEDVTENYETVFVNVTQTTTSFNVIDKDAFLSPQCTIAHSIDIDTSLDCSNNFVFEGTEDGSDYFWSDGRIDSIRTFTEPISISVWVKSCESDKEIFLNIAESECDCKVFVPNVISSKALNPENRKMLIQSNCIIESYLMSIYDRWGNLVFQSNEVNESWSPSTSYKLDQAVYTWVLKWGTREDLGSEVVYGTVMFLK